MADLEKLVFGDQADPRIELRELFATGDGDALARAREWAHGIIRKVGLEPTDQLRVIKALRDAEPKLSLKPATYLAAQLG